MNIEGPTSKSTTQRDSIAQLGTDGRDRGDLVGYLLATNPKVRSVRFIGIAMALSRRSRDRAFRPPRPPRVAVVAALRPIQDRLFREARDRGERDSYEAYAADAMAELICGGEGVGAAPDEAPSAPRHWPERPNRARPSRDIKVIVRIDHHDYLEIVSRSWQDIELKP